MITSDSVKTISEALRAAQNGFVAPLKTKTALVNMKGGGRYSYSYADLGDIIDTLRPVLNEHGLSFVQDALEADGGVRVSTRILHTSGEWIEFGPLFLPAGETPQAYGSAITYARRYALTTAFGIAAEEDDDGQAGKPARQRASGGSSSGESITPPASSSQRQQGTPPGDNVGEGTARSSLNAGGGEPRPGDAVRGNPAAPSPTTTSGTGAGEAGTAPEEYGEGSDGAVPSTTELATADDLAAAAKHGLTPTKAKALAKGLGFEWPPTREQLVAVIERYLEVKK